jgi:hypothetical protein
MGRGTEEKRDGGRGAWDEWKQKLSLHFTSSSPVPFTPLVTFSSLPSLVYEIFLLDVCFNFHYILNENGETPLFHYEKHGQRK